MPLKDADRTVNSEDFLRHKFVNCFLGALRVDLQQSYFQNNFLSGLHKAHMNHGVILILSRGLIIVPCFRY